jgi:hypothetical protein
MAQRPQRPRNQLRRYFTIPKNHCGIDRDGSFDEGSG